MVLKKQLFIFKDSNEKEIEIFSKFYKSEDSMCISGDFEIWEKDLETGRLTQLR